MKSEERYEMILEELRKLSDEELQKLINYLKDKERWHKTLHL